MKRILLVTPRIFPANAAEDEIVFQMTNENGSYIGPEITLPAVEFIEGRPLHLDLTDDGVTLVLQDSH